MAEAYQLRDIKPNYYELMSIESKRRQAEMGLVVPDDWDMIQWRDEERDTTCIKFRRVVYTGPRPGKYGFILRLTDKEAKEWADRVPELTERCWEYASSCKQIDEFCLYHYASLDTVLEATNDPAADSSPGGVS